MLILFAHRFLYLAMITIRDNFHLHWKCQRHRYYSAWKKNKCKCKSYLRKHGVFLQAQQHTHWHQGWLISNTAIVYVVSTLKIIWRKIKFYTKNSKFWKTLISWKNESRSKWKFCLPPFGKPIQTSGAVLWKCKKWERSNFTIFCYKFSKAII